MTALWLGRRELERAEEARLAPWACRSSAATRGGAPLDRADPDIRMAFQRDRDRVLHARAFRRLKHKTQVFVPHVADHARTRLTHTLEVGQLGRTVARALALNEDLVEAVALAHDLGHTAFGHIGEAVLDEILQGACAEVPLPPAVVSEVGRFKHNYQSLRVVDVLERRYDHPGLDLTDQVREGILKHTSWKVRFPFPLDGVEPLCLDGPCHLEGQAVAVADEIAQQTHDLEDGLRAGSVELAAVERLSAARRAVSDLGETYSGERRRWRRQNMLIRALIRLFVTDVVEASAARLGRLAERHGITGHDRWLEHARAVPQTTIWFSSGIEPLFAELKAFIYRGIINNWRVNRQDWRARKVVTSLFRAFHANPLTLPDYVLLRARDELGFRYLRDRPLPSLAAEISSRYHPSPGFARLVADHIAGMSDRFALEEFRSLEQPAPEQSFLEDVR